MNRSEKIKGLTFFVLTFLLLNQSEAQNLNFEINKICIDRLAVESDGMAPTCISFSITVKNISSEKKVIFKDADLGADINFGRLVYFDVAKRKYHYSLVKPVLGFINNVARKIIELDNNDSAKFTGVIYLTDLYLAYKSIGNLSVFKGAMLGRFVQNGSLFYLPGEYNKEKEWSNTLPKDAIEVKKKEGLDVLYNGGCQRNR